MIIHLDKAFYFQVLEHMKADKSYRSGRRRGLSSRRKRVQKRVVSEFINYKLTKLLKSDEFKKAINDKS